MSYPIRIWSTAYSPVGHEAEGYTVQIDKDCWEMIMRQEGSKRKFMKIEHPEGFQDWIAPLGHPVPQQHTTQTQEAKEDRIYNIYMPLWMLDAAHLKGEGEVSVLETMDEEYFPEATRIVLRVIDSAFYNADVKEELEKALSSLGVIQEHTTLQIPVEALDGYTIEVFVSKLEPANIVLCNGEEVTLEFEEPVDQIEAPVRPPTPIPPQLPLLPSLQTETETERETMIPPGFITSAAFQAFQGSGQTLGTSNADIPGWRRGLAPPPRK